VRSAARLLAVLGALGVGLFLYRSAPRDVVLVYDLSRLSGTRSLEVVLRRGHEVIRRAAFPSPAGQVRHAVRLGDGEYQLEYRLEGPSGPIQGSRTITVAGAQTIALPLGP
jgi:hypothetical protein